MIFLFVIARPKARAIKSRETWQSKTGLLRYARNDGVTVIARPKAAAIQSKQAQRINSGLLRLRLAMTARGSHA